MHHIQLFDQPVRVTATPRILWKITYLFLVDISQEDTLVSIFFLIEWVMPVFCLNKAEIYNNNIKLHLIAKTIYTGLFLI